MTKGYELSYLYFVKQTLTLKAMTITTANGARFDTSKPARSNLMMVINDKGQQVMDTLRITGKMTTETEFMKPVSMVEVEGSFGITEVHEDFLWQ